MFFKFFPRALSARQPDKSTDRFGNMTCSALRDHEVGAHGGIASTCNDFPQASASQLAWFKQKLAHWAEQRKAE